MNTDAQIRPDDKVYQYLKELGYSERHIDGLRMDSRLFHDLGLYGDSAEEDMEILQTKFGVDMASFKFGDYFPSQFEGRTKLETIIFYFIPLLAWWRRRRTSYVPLTLQMIERSMRAGRWIQ
jgi:hypothetical protein